MMMISNKPNNEKLEELAKVLEDKECIKFLYKDWFVCCHFCVSDFVWSYEIYHIDNISKDIEGNYLTDDESINSDFVEDGGLCSGSTHDVIEIIFFMI